MHKVTPNVIVLAGLPFSGKTTVGNELAKRYGFAFFDIDVSRKEIDSRSGWHGADAEREIMLAAYERNHEKAAAALNAGQTAVLAATYSRPEYHEMVREVSRQYAAPLSVFLLYVGDQLVQQRMQQRIADGSDSNILDLASYAEVRDRYKAFEGDELVRIDTADSLENVLTTIGQRVAASN